MQATRTIAQEAAEDIFFGQVVMIWARWFLIAAGVTLTLWVTQDPNQLALAIVPVVVLVGVNFYLHGRYLTEKPANPALIMLVGLVDLLVISAAILVWDGDRAGFSSPYYVLYYPVLLAFAFVMPRKATLVYTVAVIAAYLAICFVAALPDAPAFMIDATYTKALLVRVITIAAMGGLGSYYWRIQRSRRREAMGEVVDVAVGPAVSGMADLREQRVVS